MTVKVLPPPRRALSFPARTGPGSRPRALMRTSVRAVLQLAKESPHAELEDGGREVSVFVEVELRSAGSSSSHNGLRLAVMRPRSLDSSGGFVLGHWTRLGLCWKGFLLPTHRVFRHVLNIREIETTKASERTGSWSTSLAISPLAVKFPRSVFIFEMIAWVGKGRKAPSLSPSSHLRLPHSHYPLTLASRSHSPLALTFAFRSPPPLTFGFTLSTLLSLSLFVFRSPSLSASPLLALPPPSPFAFRSAPPLTFRIVRYPPPPHLIAFVAICTLTPLLPVCHHPSHLRLSALPSPPSPSPFALSPPSQRFASARLSPLLSRSASLALTQSSHPRLSRLALLSPFALPRALSRFLLTSLLRSPTPLYASTIPLTFAFHVSPSPVTLRFRSPPPPHLSPFAPLLSPLNAFAFRSNSLYHHSPFAFSPSSHAPLFALPPSSHLRLSLFHLFSTLAFRSPPPLTFASLCSPVLTSHLRLPRSCPPSSHLRPPLTLTILSLWASRSHVSSRSHLRLSLSPPPLTFRLPRSPLSHLSPLSLSHPSPPSPLRSHHTSHFRLSLSLRALLGLPPSSHFRLSPLTFASLASPLLSPSPFALPASPLSFRPLAASPSPFALPLLSPLASMLLTLLSLAHFAFRSPSPLTFAFRFFPPPPSSQPPPFRSPCLSLFASRSLLHLSPLSPLLITSPFRSPPLCILRLSLVPLPLTSASRSPPPLTVRLSLSPVLLTLAPFRSPLPLTSAFALTHASSTLNSRLTSPLALSPSSHLRLCASPPPSHLRLSLSPSSHLRLSLSPLLSPSPFGSPLLSP
ncbi:hypothetical protein C7M84_015634 [Penaeus vannamei]|uniref:Uncharacterized protein n=1 Tax=Penaeus vannamei TaxID=6689 RepID=A0A3R7MNS4_PENVA|nr:hypothetical protein C7M84_015634 [Penaeus vannamei]